MKLIFVPEQEENITDSGKGTYFYPQVLSFLFSFFIEACTLTEKTIIWEQSLFASESVDPYMCP